MIPTPEMLDAMKKALVRYSPIMPIDEALSDALTAALALLPGETVAWEVAETLPSGTIRWQVVEHEHHARKLAEKLQADVRPLYAAPAPLPVAVKELNHIPNLLGESGAIELKMIALADASPQRDPFNGEQTILTYTDRVGTWDLAFFESGEEFPDQWIGCSHWLDITKMWPGVIAQIARYKNPASMIKGELGGGDVIALVNPDRWQQAPQLAYANGWNDCLADRLQATDGDYDVNAQKLAEACYLECEQMDSYGIIDTIAKYIRSALSSPVGGAEERTATVADCNAAFDPADEAFGGAFRDGFREGWLFAKSPDFEDREEAEEDYPREVDMAPTECWDAYRSHYFAKLPLAAIPQVGSVISPIPSSDIAALREKGRLIKSLEWKGPTQKALVAEPFPGFKYTILDDERGVDWSVSDDKAGWTPVESIDEAKAACQADFESRIQNLFCTEGKDAD